MNSLPSARLFQKSLYPFNNWLAAKDVSEHTLSNYSARVASYLHFCSLLEVPQQAHTAELVNEYVLYLQHCNVKASTINQTLSALSKYFEYNELPFPKIARVPLGTSEKPVSLTSAEIDRLLAVTCGHRSLKCRVIVMLCFFGGLSSGQCAELDVKDVYIDEQGCHLKVKKKNRKIELPPIVARALAEWIHVEKLGLESPLFCNGSGNRISRIGIDYLIKSVGIEAKLMLSARLLYQSGKAYLQQNLLDGGQ